MELEPHWGWGWWWMALCSLQSLWPSDLCTTTEHIIAHQHPCQALHTCSPSSTEVASHRNKMQVLEKQKEARHLLSQYGADRSLIKQKRVR